MNKPGLSIFEVMIAVVIIGVSVTTIFRLQIVLSRGVFAAHALVDRLSFVSSYFVEAEREKFFKDEQPHVKDLNDPALKMTYIASKPANELQGFSNLVIEKIDATWPTPLGQHNETLKKAYFTGAP